MMPDEVAGTEDSGQAVEEVPAAEETEAGGDVTGNLQEMITRQQEQISQLVTELQKSRESVSNEDDGYQPMFTDDEIEEMPESEQKFYKAFNKQGETIHNLTRELESVKSTVADTSQDRTIDQFIAKHPEYGLTPDMRANLMKEVHRIIQNNDMDSLLASLVAKMQSTKKFPKSARPVGTQVPKSVAEKLTTGKGGKARGVDAAVARAKEKVMSILD